VTGQLSLFKSARQRGTRPPPALEFETHCAIADTLRRGATPGWIWTHFPAGERRDLGAAARLKRMGLKGGFPDFLLIAPDGVHHWLELKRGNAALTDDQKAFQLEMNMRGVPCAVARSYELAIAQLKEWGAVRVSLEQSARPLVPYAGQDPNERQQR
jgi:hypothetical protein